MKKILVLLAVVFVTIAFANDSAQPAIKGPNHVGKGSVILYEAILKNANNCRIFRATWNCDDANILGVVGPTVIVTIPQDKESITLCCAVEYAPEGTYNQLVLENTELQIAISDPPFIFKRKNMNGANITENAQGRTSPYSTVEIFSNVDYDNGGSKPDCQITQGIFNDDDLYDFSVRLEDTDYCANRGTITLASDPSLRVFEAANNKGSLIAQGATHFSVQLDDDTEIGSVLPDFDSFVESCNPANSGNLEFSYAELTHYLPYEPFALTPVRKKPDNYNHAKMEILNKFPNLKDVKWRFVSSAVSMHNTIAYSVVCDPPDPGIYNGHYFIVNEVLPFPCGEYALTNIIENGISKYYTSFDNFGNPPDGIFTLQDVKNFYQHPNWVYGGTAMQETASLNCKVIYFNSSFAAHRAPDFENEKLHKDWRVFRARLGNYVVDFIANGVSGIVLKFK